jgi:hypothetical protein
VSETMRLMESRARPSAVVLSFDRQTLGESRRSPEQGEAQQASAELDRQATAPHGVAFYHSGAAGEHTTGGA